MADEAEEIFQQTLNEVRRLINNLKLIKEALSRRQRARAALEFMRNARQQNPVLDRHLNDNPDRADQWNEHEWQVRQLEEENAQLAAQNAERRAELDRLQEQADQQAELNGDRDRDLVPDEIEDRHEAVDDAEQREEDTEADRQRGDGNDNGIDDRVEDEQQTADQQARDDETDRQREAREQREREEEQRRREQDGQAVDATGPVAAAVVADELNDREEQQQAQADREPELDQQAEQVRDDREPELDQQAEQVRDDREPELDQQAEQARDDREPELDQQARDGREPELDQQAEQVRDDREPELDPQARDGREPGLDQEARDGQGPELAEQGRTAEPGERPQHEQGQDYRDVMQEDGSIDNATFTVDGPDQEQGGASTGSGEVWIDGQQYHPVEQNLEGQRAERAAQQGERGPGRDVPDDERQRNQAVSFSGRAPADGAATRPDPATLQGGRGGQTAAQVHAGASRGPGGRTDGPGQER
ncbi:hypothetical protein ACIBL3_28440 [Kribbella sp. NPDC050124]|uniref:hypothetical protein n=1 Tax=Kribbella sp. NPDC050124 TaxID=3364114 RepID=UPI00378E8922